MPKVEKNPCTKRKNAHRILIIGKIYFFRKSKFHSANFAKTSKSQKKKNQLNQIEDFSNRIIYYTQTMYIKVL